MKTGIIGKGIPLANCTSLRGIDNSFMVVLQEHFHDRIGRRLQLTAFRLDFSSALSVLTVL